MPRFYKDELSGRYNIKVEYPKRVNNAYHFAAMMILFNNRPDTTYLIYNIPTEK